LITYIRLFLLLIFIIVLSVLAIISSIIDRTFTSYFWLLKIFGYGVLYISGVKLNVEGLENFDHSKVFVYVSNHSSLYDIPSLCAAFPNKTCIVFKKELAKIPLFGWQLMLGPFIIIDRQNPEKALKSIEHAKKIMKERNFSVLLFAEGTRSKTGQVQPFKRGAFHLASQVAYPIIPTSVSGTEKILPKGKLKIQSGTITVRFDKPIPADNINNKKDELELMEKVRQIIIQNKESELWQFQSRM